MKSSSISSSWFLRSRSFCGYSKLWSRGSLIKSAEMKESSKILFHQSFIPLRKFSQVSYRKKIKFQSLHPRVSFHINSLKQVVQKNFFSTGEEEEEKEENIETFSINKNEINLADFKLANIRNFAVIAHIDHGKTTICDRLLKITDTISRNTIQSLDALKVEQERGITVKAHTSTMFCKYKAKPYMLNLIDTPGHVDFNYEVSRALSACQGALLVVDATQGVQAQTVSNFFLAKDANLTIVPVINKIDIPGIDIQNVLEQLFHSFEITEDQVLMVSAKTGEAFESLIPAIIERIPPPKGDRSLPPRLFLLDSWFDRYRGVIGIFRLIDGVLKRGDKLVSYGLKKEYEVMELGLLHPHMISFPNLYAGQVGYIISGMKNSAEARAGDTFFLKGTNIEPLPGFRPARAMVYAGLYSMDSEETDKFLDAVNKLILSDSSVIVQKETSDALGTGFRCGFLGILHMEVFVQRLEQEYDVSVVITSPTVPYKVILNNGSEVIVNSASQFPEIYKECYEPMVIANIILPSSCLGNILSLCEERRGEQLELLNVDATRMRIKYKLPLAEVITNFFDKLKEMSSGYANLEFEESGYETSSICKVEILLNGEPADALAFLTHKSKAQAQGKNIVEKLKEQLDRQLFQVSIQAAIGSKIIARETLSALKKNVTAKCYGGDITRKRKLLERQKEGKKKMREIGSVPVSQETFFSILKRD